MKDDFIKERKLFEKWVMCQFDNTGKLLKKTKELEYKKSETNYLFIGFCAGFNVCNDLVLERVKK